MLCLHGYASSWTASVALKFTPSDYLEKRWWGRIVCANLICWVERETVIFYGRETMNIKAKLFGRLQIQKFYPTHKFNTRLTNKWKYKNVIDSSLLYLRDQKKDSNPNLCVIRGKMLLPFPHSCKAALIFDIGLSILAQCVVAWNCWPLKQVLLWDFLSPLSKT